MVNGPDSSGTLVGSSLLAGGSGGSITIVTTGPGLLLVAGSSLTVMSGLRFVRQAAKREIPVVIVNRGPTRGDPLATLRIDDGCSEVLTALAAQAVR